MSFDPRYWIARPPIVVVDTIQTKNCRKCGAEFTTRSRRKKRCDTCQSAVTAARGVAEDAARRERRRKGARG